MTVGELKKILSGINDDVNIAIKLPYYPDKDIDHMENQYGHICEAETMWIDFSKQKHSKSSWDLARKHDPKETESEAFALINYYLLLEYEI